MREMKLMEFDYTDPLIKWTLINMIVVISHLVSIIESIKALSCSLRLHGDFTTLTERTTRYNDLLCYCFSSQGMCDSLQSPHKHSIFLLPQRRTRAVRPAVLLRPKDRLNVSFTQ